MDDGTRGHRDMVFPMLIAALLIVAGLGLMMWQDRQGEAGSSITLSGP